jgi:hypothetical protein
VINDSSSWQVVAIDSGSDTTKFVGLLDGWADFGVTKLEELKVY